MPLRPLRVLAVGLAPVALSACIEIEPAIGSPSPTAPVIGVDLGSSGRVPQIAALAGEGEGYGRAEPNPSPTDHGAMPGMTGGPMDHGAMPGMSHGTVDHSAMPGMAHGSMDHGSMPGMRQPGQKNMAAAEGSGSGGMQMAHSGQAHVQGAGTVNSVDGTGHKLNVSHGPISTIGWPAMTMDFAVAPSVDLSAVKPGTPIRFEMEQGKDGMYVIQSISPAGGGQQ